MVSNVSGTIVSNKGYKVEYDIKKFGEQIEDIIKNGDKYGVKTEKIVNDILKNNPNLIVYDGKYSGNKGIDHLVYNKNTKEFWVIDSKQIGDAKKLESGSIPILNDGAKGERQLSKAWIEAVAKQLPKELKNELLNAVKKEKVRTAVIGVNKKTRDIKLVPIIVEDK